MAFNQLRREKGWFESSIMVLVEFYYLNYRLLQMNPTKMEAPSVFVKNVRGGFINRNSTQSRNGPKNVPKKKPPGSASDTPLSLRAQQAGGSKLVHCLFRSTSCPCIVAQRSAVSSCL